MTAYHELITLPDSSVAVRCWAGGRWKVLRGPTNGVGDIFNCAASRFVDDQNKTILRSFQRAVEEYVGRGEAA